MIYSGKLLKINGKIIPKIKTYEIQRQKLWKNAQRTMGGDAKGQLIGIYPNLEIEIGYTTQEEMKEISVLLDSPFFNIEYFDSRIGGVLTADYYASDYNTILHTTDPLIYKPFKATLVSVSRRKYD